MDIINEVLEKHGGEDGFLFNLRYRIFDYDQGVELLNILKKVEPLQGEVVEVRFFRNVWDIAKFLYIRLWDFTEAKVLPEAELIKLRNLCNLIVSEVDRIINAGKLESLL